MLQLNLGPLVASDRLFIATCVADRSRFERLLRASVERCVPEAEIIARHARRSLGATYNEILDEVAKFDGEHIVVFVHEDVVIQDASLQEKLTVIFRDEAVAIIGVVGARRPRSLAWHSIAECYGRVVESRYAIQWLPAPAEVDVCDGFLLALSPWATRNLRFETAPELGFHGYDVDICLQARSAGKRVLVGEIAVIHVTKGGYGREFDRANRFWLRKWYGSDFTAIRVVDVATSTRLLSAVLRSMHRVGLSVGGARSKLYLQQRRILARLRLPA